MQGDIYISFIFKILPFEIKIHLSIISSFDEYSIILHFSYDYMEIDIRIENKNKI